MEMKEIESAVEGILFASGEPVQTDRICVALEMDRPTVEQVLQKLMDYYAYERRGHPAAAHGGYLAAVFRAGLRGCDPKSL